ncbi:hypothetical protein INR49_022436 [Caranx melampygus]|nr:hypothetical protein INR49_022436 [Caranx melampygus]
MCHCSAGELVLRPLLPVEPPLSTEQVPYMAGWPTAGQQGDGHIREVVLAKGRKAIARFVVSGLLHCPLYDKMEDFEYSVEISDRDWECFFAECEECNLLPPSLAGVDDSGMSDMDDKGSILLKRTQKVDITAGFSEADRPIDGPPDCEGSPVEDYLGKHGVSGMESVLSGSEEDIHLQSINIFFERLKNLTEAAEPSQVRAGKNREAIQKDEQHSDGQQSSSSSLPKNIPKLNSLPARGETAIGKESMGPVDTVSNINTMKKVEPCSSVSPEPAASNSALKTNKSTCPKTELFIREEACTEIGVNEVTQQNDSPDGAVCSEAPPHTAGGIKLDEPKPKPTNEDTPNVPHSVESGCIRPIDSSSREFDKENYFFNPLFTEDDQAKDELVPIFSYNRSANTNLQYPEAYDYLFSSSSPDDSSGESEEEGDKVPVRVVSRFSRKASSSQISTDIYDNFFSDSDLKQNFFWKTTLSFRNVNFTGSTVQNQSPSSSLAHVPERQSDRPLRRAVYPSNVLGNQDVMFPDPLLYHLEDRILRQQAQQPFRYEDLQMVAVSNPILLANVSALSAIRYLRKYVKMEAAATPSHGRGAELEGGGQELGSFLLLVVVPLWASMMHCRVGCAVDLRQHRGLHRLEVGATLGRAVSVEEGRLELYCRDNKHSQSKNSVGESCGAKVTPQATKTESGDEAPNIRASLGCSSGG